MGDTTMKLILVLSLVSLLSSFVFADDFTWIKKQIEEIKPPRVGIDVKKIELLKDPFIFLEKNKTPKKEQKGNQKGKQNGSMVASDGKKIPQIEPTFTLRAIINKTALINKKWYNLGDIIHGYKLIKITTTDVILKKGTKRKHLTILTKNKFKDHRKKK
jgi:hypothetical protein